MCLSCYPVQTIVCLNCWSVRKGRAFGDLQWVTIVKQQVEDQLIVFINVDYLEVAGPPQQLPGSPKLTSANLSVVSNTVWASSTALLFCQSVSLVMWHTSRRHSWLSSVYGLCVILPSLILSMFSNIGTEEECRRQGITFLPMAAESLGGWHKVAVDQVEKLARAIARHTGQQFEEAQRHLWQSLSVHLMKGNAQLLANRIPEEETS